MAQTCKYIWFILLLLLCASPSAYCRTFSPIAKNNCQYADSIRHELTIVFACDEKHFNVPVDSVAHVYVHGSNYEWKGDSACVLDSISEDSCFYRTFPYEAVARPGNSGQPEIQFYVELTNDSAFYLLPVMEGEGAIDHRLMFVNTDTVVMLLLPNGSAYFTTNLDTLHARCVEAQTIRPLSDFDLTDSVDQHRISNFRLTPGTTCLYRSFHPYYPDKPQYDTERQRLYWVGELATRAGIRSDITLSSNQENTVGMHIATVKDSIKITMPTYHRQLLQKGNILYVGQQSGVRPSVGQCYYHSDGPYFAEWLKEVVTFINDTTHPLPIQIHCALGADRTGMFCATLAALCGADWTAIMADYTATGDMQNQSYRHPNRLRYAFERMTGLCPDSVSTEELTNAVRRHFVDMGVLREGETDSLVARLNTPVTPAAPIVGLPRICLQYDVLDRDTFNLGTFTFTDEQDTLKLGMKIRHRGSYSARFDKKAFAIKLLDQNGKKYEASFLGMRKDNYWILDAMAGDKARMRNRVCMDLWLEMARQPWYKNAAPKLVNGYRGRMVEVYVNNQPQGIYCLMERIDRKQLKLAKYEEGEPIQSTLYKSIRAERSGFESKPLYKPSERTTLWDYQWEPKLPDYEDGEPIEWTPLYNMFNFIWKSDTQLFQDSIYSYVDLPVWMDYELICNLLSAWDNTSKNLYMSYYDLPKHGCGVVTPWDMDHSLGRKWNATIEGYDNLLFSKNKLSVRLREEYPEYTDSLESRWAELRQSTLSLEHMDSLMDSYFELYHLTQMDWKEELLWSSSYRISLNLDEEKTYMHQWMEQRMNFLDEYYHYYGPPTSCRQEQHRPAVRKQLGNGTLYILNGNQWFDCLGRPCSR